MSADATDAALVRYGAMLAGLGEVAEIRWVHVAAGQPSEPAQVLAGMTETVARHFPAQDSTRFTNCHLLQGDRLDALLEFSTRFQVDLALLGHRPGRSPLARRMAMQAPCSVWMVPEGSPCSLKKILIPVDFSRHSADAVKVATAVAALAGVDECQALHVCFNEAAATYEEYGETMKEEAEQAFGLFIAPIDLHGVNVKLLVSEGPTASRTICRIAGEQKSDLIVMSTRGRSRSAAILFGSETEHTMMETPVPLLAVKHFGPHVRLLQALREDHFLRGRAGPKFS